MNLSNNKDKTLNNIHLKYKNVNPLSLHSDERLLNSLTWAHSIGKKNYFEIYSAHENLMGQEKALNDFKLLSTKHKLKELGLLILKGCYENLVKYENKTFAYKNTDEAVNLWGIFESVLLKNSQDFWQLFGSFQKNQGKSTSAKLLNSLIKEYGLSFAIVESNATPYLDNKLLKTLVLNNQNHASKFFKDNFNSPPNWEKILKYKKTNFIDVTSIFNKNK